MKLTQEARTRFLEKKDHAAGGDKGEEGERREREREEGIRRGVDGERSNQPVRWRGKEVGGATQIKCR